MDSVFEGEYDAHDFTHKYTYAGNEKGRQRCGQQRQSVTRRECSSNPTLNLDDVEEI